MPKVKHFLQCTADTPQGWLQVSRQARRVEQDTYRSVHTAWMIQGRMRDCSRFPAGMRTRLQGVLPLAAQGVVAVHGAAWDEGSYAERCASSKRIAAAAGIRRWYQTGPPGVSKNKPP